LKLWLDIAVPTHCEELHFFTARKLIFTF